METAGIGTVTGLYGVSNINNAILVDSEEVFGNIKRGIEKIISEKEGLSGFRAIAGKQSDIDLIIVQIPPYPQAVAEAVSELYVFGVRNIIMISQGYRLSKKISIPSVLVAQGAIARDYLSSKIAGEGLPLLASQRLATGFKNLVEIRFSDFQWVYGFTVSLASPRIKWVSGELKDLAGKRGVYAVDSMTAMLYALQYEFQRLETLSLLILSRSYTYTGSTMFQSYDEFSSLREKEVRYGSVLYMAAVELFRQLERRASRHEEQRR